MVIIELRGPKSVIRTNDDVYFIDDLSKKDILKILGLSGSDNYAYFTHVKIHSDIFFPCNILAIFNEWYFLHCHDIILSVKIAGDTWKFKWESDIGIICHNITKKSKAFKISFHVSDGTAFEPFNY